MRESDISIAAADGAPLAATLFLPDGDGPYDVLGRETRVMTRYGGHYEGLHGALIDDVYEGELGVSTVDPGRAWAKGRSSFTIQWPEVTCTTVGTLDVRSDADAIHVAVELVATRDGEPFATRSWHESFPRTF